MNGIHGTGRRLGLESLSTEGADALVGVWPDQQQAGQDTQQRCDYRWDAAMRLRMQYRRNLVFPLGLKQVFIPKNKHFEIETMENLKDITMKVQDPLCGGMQSIRIMKCGHCSRAGRGGGTDLNDSDVLNSATLGTLYRLHTLIKLKYCRKNNVGIVLHT